MLSSSDKYALLTNKLNVNIVLNLNPVGMTFEEIRDLVGTDPTKAIQHLKEYKLLYGDVRYRLTFRGILLRQHIEDLINTLNI